MFSCHLMIDLTILCSMNFDIALWWLLLVLLCWVWGDDRERVSWCFLMSLLMSQWPILLVCCGASRRAGRRKTGDAFRWNSTGILVARFCLCSCVHEACTHSQQASLLAKASAPGLQKVKLQRSVAENSAELTSLVRSVFLLTKSCCEWVQTESVTKE